MKLFKPSRGFTLLELIVVIVIMGILASMIIPTFARNIQKTREHTTLTTLSALARETQALHAFDEGVFTTTQVETAIKETPAALAGLWADGVMTPVEHSTKTVPGAGEVIYLINPDSVAYSMRAGSNVCALLFDASKILAQGCVANAADPVKDITDNPTKWNDGTATGGSGNGNGETNSGGDNDVLLAPLVKAIFDTDVYKIKVSFTTPGATSYKILRSVNSGAYTELTTTSSTFILDPVTPGNTYSYQAVASKGTLTSVASTKTAPLTVVPAVPENLQASVNGNDVTFTWDPALGATGYSLYDTDSNLVGLSTSTTFTKAFQAGQSSSIYVKGTNAGGASAASSPVDVLTAPGAPVNIKTVITGTQVALSWDASPGADSYKLSYGSTTLTTSTTSVNVDASLGDTITFNLVASNNAGDSPATTKTVTFPPSIVKNLALKVSGTTGTLTWDAPAGATGFNIYIDGNITQTTFTPSATISVPEGSNASVSVEAYNAGGRGAAAFVSASGVPAAPSNIRTSSTQGASGTVFTFTWDPSAGATSYEVSLNGVSVKLTTDPNASVTVPFDTSATVSFTASNASGTSSSNSLTVKGAPSGPGDITHSLNGSTLTLSWTGSASATGYRVAPLGSLDGPFLADTSAKSASFQVSIPAGTTASYAVIAYNPWGSSWSRVDVVSAPSAPANVTYTATSDAKGVTLTWDPVVGTNGYRLYFDGSSSPQSTLNTSYTYPDLTYGSHTVDVQAYNAAGTSDSTRVNVSPLLSGPVQSLSGAGGDETLTVSWSAPLNATNAAVNGYLVTIPGVGAYSTSSLSYTANGVPAGTYNVSVSGTHGGVEGVSTSTTVTVNASMTLSYPQTSFTSASQALSPLVANANKPVSYSYTGTLPAGVSFNSSNGVFTGPALTAGSSFSQIELSFGGTVAALDANGDVWAWGNNPSNQIKSGAGVVSNPTLLSKDLTPAAGLKFVKIFVGDSLFWGQTSDNRVFVYGTDASGGYSTGLGSTNTTPKWSEVNAGAGAFAPGSKIDSIASGYTSTAYLIGGKVYVGGKTPMEVAKGSASMPYNLSASAPLSTKTITRLWYEANGYFALTSTGDLYTWGFNGSGQRGTGGIYGSTANVTTPTYVIGGVSDLRFNAGTVFAKLTTGKYLVWGDNYGFYGDDANLSATSPTNFMPTIFNTDPIQNMALEGNTVFVTTQSGKSYSWGPKGSATGSLQSAPLLRSSLFDGNVTSLKAGNTTLVAFTDKGSAYVWGANSQGAFGNNTTSPSYQAVPQKSSTFGSVAPGWPFATTVTATDAQGRKASAGLTFTLG